MKTKNIINSILTIVFALSIVTVEGQSCTQCDNTGSPAGTYASEVGQNTTAEGSYSFAGGINSTSQGNVSFAFGQSAIANGGVSFALGASVTAANSNSYALGTFCTASGSQSFVLGNGLNSSTILSNSIGNSLIIGFNSDKPTFFVGGASGSNTTGRIGIGNVTDPQAKLHIKGDDSEDADLLLEPGASHYAKIKFDGTANRIEAKGTLDLNFHTASDFVFWDGNVGIGNYNPTEKLDVAGNIKSTGFILNNGQQAMGKILQSDANGLASWVDPLTLSVDDGDWTIDGNDVFRLNGNVGIGTSAPATKLDVAGTVHATSFSGDGSGLANVNNDWEINGANVYHLDGNVGIGTTLNNNPNDYKLAVNGIIGTKEIYIENTSLAWSDYVFDANYNLPPLDQVEEFIKNNGHLPEVPTANEVENDGFKLAEMNALLLKKVEELTLYLIDLKKENETLHKKVDRIQFEINQSH